MARTPSMTTAEAEALLGPRGNLLITADNRPVVRKWLVAHGVDSAYVATLRYEQMSAAYNHTDDSTLNQLRQNGQGAFDRDIPTQWGEPEDYQPQSCGAAATSPGDKAAMLLRDLGELIQAGGIDETAVRAIVADELDKSKIARIEFKRRDGRELKLDGHYHPNFVTLCKMAASFDHQGRVPGILIRGESSSGKSYGAQQLAKAMGVKFYSHGPITDPVELLGFIDGAGTYHRTGFRDAFEYGGLACLDELDGYDPSAALGVNPHMGGQSVVQFPDGMVERHPDFICIATANTWGFGADSNYVGRNKLDAATLSRFPLKLTWNIDEEFERTLVNSPSWCARVQAARAKAKAAGLKVMICSRIAIAGAALINAGMTEQEAAEHTYLAVMTTDQRKMIEA